MFLRVIFVRLLSFIILSFFWTAGVVGQNKYQPIFKNSSPSGFQYLDSLSALLEVTDEPEDRLLILNDLAYYWHTRDLIYADSLAVVALEEAHRKESDYMHNLIEVTYAAILLRSERLTEAEQLLLNALDQLKPEDKPMALTQLGYVEERRGNLDKAIFYANENKNLGESINNLWAQAMAHSDLSNLFWKQGKYQQGLEYGLRSLSLFEKRGVLDLDYDFTLYLVANNYISLGQEAEALRYLEKSIEIGERFGFYNNLSDAYIAEVDLYTDMGLYDDAISAYEKSMKYAQLLNNAFMQMRTLLSYGRLLNKQGKYYEAISALKRSLSIATDVFGDDYYLAQVYFQLNVAYVGMGDYQNAHTALVSHHQYQDNVITREATERMSELQTLYETTQKEKTISEQRAKLGRQSVTLFSAVGVLGILGIASFLLYRLNQRLKDRNREKDILLKEIHHRVKNNLQILSSLLSLQSQYIKDEKALDAIQEGRNRVESMGLIHQKLFSADNITGVDMNDYVSQLCDYLKQSFSTGSKKIEVEHDIKIGLMDIDSAIPLGLIINELITNTCKYAVTEDNVSRIKIGLWVDEEKNLSLIVSDNGITSDNIPSDYSSTSFGTDLVKILSKKLKGTVAINTDNGYETQICFKRYKLIEKA